MVLVGSTVVLNSEKQSCHPFLETLSSVVQLNTSPAFRVAGTASALSVVTTCFEVESILRKEKFEEKKIIILVVADTMKKNNIFFGGSFHQNPACGQNNFCHHILLTCI